MRDTYRAQVLWTLLALAAPTSLNSLAVFFIGRQGLQLRVA